MVQLLEPDLKEGVGGLRDVHTLMWIAKVKHHCDSFGDLVREGLITPQEQEDIQVGYDFLLQVRCCIHFLNQKKDDRLSFGLQPQVAEELGFVPEGPFQSVEIFLKVFYHHTKTLNRLVEAVLSRWSRRKVSVLPKMEMDSHPHFKVEEQALDLVRRVGNPFRGNLNLILDFFALANQGDFSYSHHAILRIKQAVSLFSKQELQDLSQPLRHFLALCQKPGRVGRMLRCMNDVGLIGLLIPDFNVIYCHSQHDIYHIYTTDEHTITVVRQLAKLADRTEKELASLQGALAQVTDREILVLVCFFHDIGKGVGPSHSTSGARMIFEFMEAMDFSASRCLAASNLVLHHLLMNETIQRRDLEDPKTIRDFAAKMEGPAFLHKLYVLTYCDVSSVHPSAWSSWKASLLQQLYDATLILLIQPFQTAESRRRGPQEEEILVSLERVLSKAAAKVHLQALTENYLVAHTSEEIASHADLLKKIESDKFGVQVIAKSTHWDITVAAKDEKALLCRISGSLAYLGLSILSAKIYTLGGSRVIDRFWVQPPKWESESPQSLRDKILVELLRDNLTGRMSLHELRNRHLNFLSCRENKMSVPPKVLVSNKISDVYTVIDVTCPDQIGLLFQVASVLSALALNVYGAVLTTEADKAMDAFYITDEKGFKIQDEQKKMEIITILESELKLQ